MKKKLFPMREPIPREFRTFFEHIEYWSIKRGLGGKRLYCKWHKTLIRETIDSISLDTSKIKFEKK